MAWRIVKTPNGKYARFADPVDNFTHYDMTREEAVKLCRKYLGEDDSDTKVTSADENPSRYEEALQTISTIHGREATIAMRLLIEQGQPSDRSRTLPPFVPPEEA